MQIIVFISKRATVVQQRLEVLFESGKETITAPLVHNRSQN